MQSRAHPAVSSPKDFTLTGRKCKSTGVSFDLSAQYDLTETPVHHVDCQTLCEPLWYLISRFSLHACFPTSCSSAQVTSVSDSSCLYLCICLFVFFLSSVKALPSWCRSPTSIRPTQSTSTPSTGSTPTRKSTRLTLTCSRYEL